MGAPLHIAWVNETPELAGGCEHYVYDTVNLLNRRGIRSSLLYDNANSCRSRAMTAAFTAAFPLVDPVRQVRELRPDVIYLHRWMRIELLEQLVAMGIPIARFFHDHRWLCLREHKYKALSHETCTSPIGLRCYACLGFVQRVDTFPRFRLRTLHRLRKELALSQQLDACVVGSRYLAGHLEAHGFDPNKIKILPLYSPPPEEPDAPVPREPDLLLCVGHLVRGKGLDLLLRALPLMKHPARLAVAGHGWQEPMFRRMAERLEVQDRVTFLGVIPRTALSEWYRRAACVVIPTRLPETFCLVGTEAMSHGTPVVATAVGGIADWLEHGVTGLSVKPNDPAALAAAVDTVLSDRALAARMGAAGREHYAQRFRPEHHVDKLVPFLESLAGNGHVKNERVAPPA